MIIIRADGGNGIGMGHLARTSVLADELLKCEEVVYVCSTQYAEGISFLRNKGYNVIEAEDVVETLLSIAAECIITDSYQIDENYIEQIRRHFDVVGYIDDNALIDYKADFIINQNYKADEIEYKVNAGCNMLLGSNYLLVRDEFRNIKPIPINNEVKKILLTVGGSDKWNYTDKLLAGLVDQLPFEFHVVIGPVFPYGEEVMEKYSKHSNVVFERMPCMSKLASECEIAISSCGSTLYELGLVGIPTLGVIVADNQEGLAARMNEQGLIRCLGDIQELSGETLRNEVLKMADAPQNRMNMQKRNLEELNANGVEVIVKHVLKLIKSKNNIKRLI